MRRATRIAIWVVGGSIAAPILLSAALLIWFGTAPGWRMVEALAPPLTHGEIAIEGFRFRFPGRIVARKVEIADPGGIWARVADLRIDWSPIAFLRGIVKLASLTAGRVRILRLPESSGASGGVPRILVERLSVGRLEVGRSLAGHAVAFGVTGSLRLDSLQRGVIDVAARQLGGAGRYRVSGTIGEKGISARVQAVEPARGPLAQIVGLPDLGRVSFDTRLAGPRTAERVSVAFAAGPMRAAGHGTIDLLAQTADFDISGRAPAMAPRPDLSWQSLTLNAHVRGPFARPVVLGRLVADGIVADGAAIARLTGRVGAKEGKLGIGAIAEGLRLPGPRPDLFAAAPIGLTAEARLDNPRPKVTFTLSHPLFAVTGTAEKAKGGEVAGSLKATLSALAPIAATSGLDLDGHAAFEASFSAKAGSARVSGKGAIGLRRAPAAAMRLLGDEIKLAVAARFREGGIDVERAAVHGRAVEATAEGSIKGGALAFLWNLELPNLARLDPRLSGALAAKGRVDGPATALSASASLKGKVGGPGFTEAAVSAKLDARDLPGAPEARIEAESRLAGAPLRLVATAVRATDGALSFAIERAEWRGGEAAGKLTLAPGASFPLGEVRVTMTRLGRLQPLIHAAVNGSLNGRIDLLAAQGKPRAGLRIDIRRLAQGGRSIDRATLGGTIDDPLHDPTLALDLKLDGIKATGVAGGARLSATGPLAAPKFRFSASLRTSEGPAQITAAGSATLVRRQFELSALAASYGGEEARLLTPAHFDFKNGLAIGGLRVGVGRSAVTLAAHLRGSLAEPTGTIRMTASGLGIGSGPARVFPAAALTARADLAGTAARLDARLGAGSKLLVHLAGTAPLRGTGPLDLRASGTVDLSLADPFLATSGRNLRGELTINGRIGGTLAAPRLSGSARLVRGDFQDFELGTHLSEIAAEFATDGDKLRIRSLTGRAGPGRISVGGTIGVLAPGIPVDLAISAENARPLSSDLLTAYLDGKLMVRGQAIGGPLTLGGTIRVERANVNIPESFPARVAVLAVERSGQRAPQPAVSGSRIALALGIDAPSRIFVRGHGLDAELGGHLRLAGTAAAPLVSGGFELRRGNLSVAGKTLTLTSGKVTFNGAGLGRRLDPAIDFVATGASSSVAATLEVSGYADAPKFTLSSSPPLPQDEVLSQLFFGQSVRQLSPFQLAAIAQGLAQLGGVGGGDPLASIRSSLGLDELSAGAGTTGGAAVSAGKYVASGIYLGGTQSTTGSTQAQVRIDLTKHLKVQSTLGTGGGTPTAPITPQNDPGSSLGLTYQFEY